MGSDTTAKVNVAVIEFGMFVMATFRRYLHLKRYARELKTIHQRGKDTNPLSSYIGRNSNRA